MTFTGSGKDIGQLHSFAEERQFMTSHKRAKY